MSNISTKSPDPTGILVGLAPTQPDLYDPITEEEAEKVHRFKTLHQAAYNSASHRVLDDNIALAATFGDQYLAVAPDTGTIYRVVDSTQSQYISQNNQLIVSHLGLWGKLTKDDPQFSVMPGGAGQADMYGARAAEKFIEHYSITRKLKEMLETIKSDATWSKLGGCLELDWDVQGGSDFWHCFSCGYSTDQEIPAAIACPQCEQNQHQYQQQMQQFQMQAAQPMPQGQMQGPGPGQSMTPGMPPGAPQQPIQPPQPPPSPGMLEQLNRGGPRFRDIDPRNVFLQPGVEEAKNVQWYTTQEPLPVQLVRAAFPDKALLIYPEAGVYPNHGARWTITDSSYVTSEELNDHVYLYRLVEGPSGLHPNGRITFMANNRILGERDGFYKDFGRLPLFRMGWLPVRGTPYFRPPAADGLPRQRELNRIETQLSENASVIARPKVVLPFGSRVAIDELTSQSIQVLQPTLASAGQVRYLLPPMMSQDVYTRRQTCTDDIRQVYTVTAQQLGGTDDVSGRYAAITEASSDQTTGPILRAHQREHADMMRCMLILVQQFGDPEEKFFALGDDNQELYMFQDLMFRSKYSNVGIIPSSGMSSNSAIQQQQANTQLQLGLFVDPETGQVDKSAYAEAAGLKLRSLQPSMTDLDNQRAYSAIAKLKDGLPYQPKQYDNPQVFADILMQWLKANENRYEQSNPMLIQQVTDLMMYYQNLIQQAQQAQAAQAAAAAPQAPGGQPSTSAGSSSAPGGSPNNAVDASGPDTSAEQIKKGADAAGEKAARGLVAHEG